MQIFILWYIEVFAYYAFILVMSPITRTTNRTRLNNEMLQFQALLLAYHQIAIALKIVNYKKFDVVPQLTGRQKVHTDSKIMMIQPVQALTDFSQERLNTCIVLNYATVSKFDMLQ